MATILTAAAVRALEQAAIERGEVTGLELMERAGAGVVEAILAEWPGIEDGARHAVVLCGPGNNGGDGFVVARLLRERGWDVAAFLYGDAEKLPPDAKANHNRWAEIEKVRNLGLGALPDLHRLGRDPAETLWIDGLFGIGLNRDLDRPTGWLIRHAEWAAMMDGSQHRVLALDVPSGLDADTGGFRMEWGGPDPAAYSPPEGVPDVGDMFIPMHADLTVTFHVAKPGHYLGFGPEFCGKVCVVDIGLDSATITHPETSTALVDDSQPWFTTRFAKRTGHKYGYGHAVILAGGWGKGGAARMAARGALRIGAGLVTLAVPPAALQENAGRLDAVMLRSVRDADALAEFLADDRLNALGAGPGLGLGLGLGEAQGALVATVLGLKRPTVLDADALTLVARDDALRAALHEAVVLTPHEGEFKRLFPEIDARWRAPATSGPAFSKVDAAREAAREAGCVVLLKGPDTVIAEPGGRAAINAAVHERAAPWLATAGSGDVLAGFIVGLLARGFAPFDAACTAAWLHVECARSFGPGLIAEDLADELPKVFRALGL